MLKILVQAQGIIIIISTGDRVVTGKITFKVTSIGTTQVFFFFVFFF